MRLCHMRAQFCVREYTHVRTLISYLSAELNILLLLLLLFFRKHYKEYLVEMINRYALDPAVLMDHNELSAVIRREGKDIPKREGREADAAYKARLYQVNVDSD